MAAAAPAPSSSSAAVNAVDGYNQSAADSKEHVGEDPYRVPHVSQVQPVQGLFSSKAQLCEIDLP